MSPCHRSADRSTHASREHAAPHGRPRGRRVVRLGLNLGYAGAQVDDLAGLVRHAERVGLHSVWAGEAYGADAVSVLGYLAALTDRIKLGAAVLQMPARTPANAAMTASTLDVLSQGRLLLGLGVSGPQVVEGWHGVAYGRPLQRTREYVAIVRQAVAGRGPLTHTGQTYQIPYRGPDATGLGKPLTSILPPVRPSIPVFLAALGPRNIRLAGEIADGWLPVLYSPEREDAMVEQLAAGAAVARRPPGAVTVAATVQVAVGDDLDACRDRVRPVIALYVGGMGSRQPNFYADLATRYGFGDATHRIQDLYLAGHRAEAAAAVPDALVDEVALVGPLDRVIDRLDAWRASRVDLLLLATDQRAVLEPLMAAL